MTIHYVSCGILFYCQTTWASYRSSFRLRSTDVKKPCHTASGTLNWVLTTLLQPFVSFAEMYIDCTMCVCAIPSRSGTARTFQWILASHFARGWPNTRVSMCKAKLLYSVVEFQQLWFAFLPTVRLHQWFLFPVYGLFQWRMTVLPISGI